MNIINYTYLMCTVIFSDIHIYSYVNIPVKLTTVKIMNISITQINFPVPVCNLFLLSLSAFHQSPGNHGSAVTIH